MAVNANPAGCDGIIVGCCTNPIPEVLAATFNPTPVCGYSGTVYLKWDNATLQWISPRTVGCGGTEQLALACSGTAWILSINFPTSPCMYSISPTSWSCDGASGIALAF